MNLVTSPGVDGVQDPANYALATILLGETNRLRENSGSEAESKFAERQDFILPIRRLFLFGTAGPSMVLSTRSLYRGTATRQLHKEASYLSNDQIRERLSSASILGIAFY